VIEFIFVIIILYIGISLVMWYNKVSRYIFYMWSVLVIVDIAVMFFILSSIVYQNGHTVYYEDGRVITFIPESYIESKWR